MRDETAKDNHQTTVLISHDSTKNNELAFSCTRNLQFYRFEILKLFFLQFRLNWSLLRFVRYLLRFHLASDRPRNNKHSRNFLWCSWFYGKDCNNFINRSFLSSPVPWFQNVSKCKTFHMKMSSACSFIRMQIKFIFIRMVSHLDSLWSRSTREPGNGLLTIKVNNNYK